MNIRLLALLVIGVFPIFAMAQTKREVPVELVIEAYVDGPSTLHITNEGLYWTNGWAAKPGRINAENHPTVINGKEWTPRWIKDEDDRGQDRSDIFLIELPSIEYKLEVQGISDRRGSSRKEKRTQPSLERKGGELRVIIPDPEPGPKWYKLKLEPVKKK